MANTAKCKANNKKLISKEVEVEVERPRRSLTLLPLSPLSLIDSLSRTSLSYDKLPDEPLKLSILKLDSSCFFIEVAKTANVAALKLAVEAVFTRLPQKGQRKVSWPYLWGRFCLCYNGQKLVVDADYISEYGIKDGDQLHFMRHVSITYDLVKKQPKNRFFASKPNNKSQSRSMIFAKEEKKKKGQYSSNGRENRKVHHYADQGCLARQHATKLSHLFGKWFSHSKIATVGKRRVCVLTRPTKVTTAVLGGLKKIVQCCSKRWHVGSDSLQNTVSSKRYLVD